MDSRSPMGAGDKLQRERRVSGGMDSRSPIGAGDKLRGKDG